MPPKPRTPRTPKTPQRGVRSSPRANSDPQADKEKFNTAEEMFKAYSEAGARQGKPESSRAAQAQGGKHRDENPLTDEIGKNAQTLFNRGRDSQQSMPQSTYTGEEAANPLQNLMPEEAGSQPGSSHNPYRKPYENPLSRVSASPASVHTNFELDEQRENYLQNSPLHGDASGEEEAGGPRRNLVDERLSKARKGKSAMQPSVDDATDEDLPDHTRLRQQQSSGSHHTPINNAPYANNMPEASESVPNPHMSDNNGREAQAQGTVPSGSRQEAHYGQPNGSHYRPANNPLGFGQPSGSTRQSGSQHTPTNNLFGQPSGSTRQSGSLFGQPSGSTRQSGSLFGQPSGSTRQSGSLFGQPSGSMRQSGSQHTPANIPQSNSGQEARSRQPSGSQRTPANNSRSTNTMPQSNSGQEARSRQPSGSQRTPANNGRSTNTMPQSNSGQEAHYEQPSGSQRTPANNGRSTNTMPQSNSGQETHYEQPSGSQRTPANNGRSTNTMPQSNSGQETHYEQPSGSQRRLSDDRSDEDMLSGYGPEQPLPSDTSMNSYDPDEYINGHPPTSHETYINGHPLTSRETYIGWCNKGSFKRKFFVINGTLPNEQWNVRNASTLSKSETFENERDIGLNVSNDGFIKLANYNLCFQDMLIKGVCWVKHGANVHIYYIVTWDIEGFEYNRYAITENKLTQLRLELENEKRVSKALLHERLRSWVTTTESIPNYDPHFCIPYQLPALFGQRKYLSAHNSQGPQVGKYLPTRPGEHRQPPNGGIRQFTSNRNVGSSDFPETWRARSSPNQNTGGNEFVRMADVNSMFESFKEDIMKNIHTMLERFLQRTSSPETFSEGEGRRGSRRFGHTMRETNWDNDENAAEMRHLRESGGYNEYFSGPRRH